MFKTGQSYGTLMDRLGKDRPMVSDGATGTYLQERGLEPGGCPEELNISKPDLIRQMAKDYFDAGSDMVLTNSFGGNKFMLNKYGYREKLRQINKLAAQHARDSASPDQYVVGSVGPTGEFIEPLGPVSPDEMFDSFVEQVTALEEGGADAVVIETMTALEEATLAIKAARDNTKLAVMATMTFDPGPRGFFTMMGVSPERAANELGNAGAHVIGANCGNGIDNMIKIARLIRETTDVYTIIHSNAGMPVIVKGQIVYPETPEYMAERFVTLIDIGIDIVGGCCGTTPNHIRALSDILK